MINKDSSIGYIEDKLGALSDSIAKENHFKILIDKYKSLIDISKDKFESTEGEEHEQIKNEMITQSDKLAKYNDLLIMQTKLRRLEMSSLKKYSEDTDSANETHCLLKHSVGEMIKNFEVYQSTTSQEDFDIYILSLDILNEIIILYFGFDIPPCSACISDMLKEK